MPDTRKREAEYRATRGFEYPESLAIRNRLRQGENLSQDERGDMVYARKGHLISPPSDLKDSWLKRGLIVTDEEWQEMKKEKKEGDEDDA